MDTTANILSPVSGASGAPLSKGMATKACSPSLSPLKILEALEEQITDETILSQIREARSRAERDIKKRIKDRNVKGPPPTTATIQDICASAGLTPIVSLVYNGRTVTCRLDTEDLWKWAIEMCSTKMRAIFREKGIPDSIPLFSLIEGRETPLETVYKAFKTLGISQDVSFQSAQEPVVLSPLPAYACKHVPTPAYQARPSRRSVINYPDTAFEEERMVKRLIDLLPTVDRMKFVEEKKLRPLYTMRTTIKTRGTHPLVSTFTRACDRMGVIPKVSLSFGEMVETCDLSTQSILKTAARILNKTPTDLDGEVNYVNYFSPQKRETTVHRLQGIFNEHGITATVTFTRGPASAIQDEPTQTSEPAEALAL